MNVRRELGNALNPLRFLLSMPKRRDARAEVLLDIRRIRLNRPIFYLCSYLTSAGYVVDVKVDLRSFARVDSYGSRIFSLPGVRAVWGLRHDYQLIITDEDGVNSTRNAKVLEVDVDIFTALNEGAISSSDLFYPMGFHPILLSSAETGALVDKRMHTKSIGLLFAGNIRPENYDNPITRNLFRVMTRAEIVEALRSSRSASSMVVEPSSYDELRTLAAGGRLRNKFVLCDRSKCQIPWSDWLDVLSSARYFLCPPGNIQPHCHNIIESMGVGTVPVTQLAGFFHPQLSDSENIVAFEDGAELDGKVVELLKDIESPQARNLSKNAAEYYDAFLSPGALRRSVASFLSSNSVRAVLFVNWGEYTASIMLERLVAALNGPPASRKNSAD